MREVQSGEQVVRVNVGVVGNGRSGLRRTLVALFAITALVAALLVIVAQTAQRAAATTGSSCGTTVTVIACENRQPGTPESVWDIAGAGDSTIQGFSTDISVNAGSPISFKIKTSTEYTIDIYRLGYYGGDGASLKVSNLSHVSPVSQPTCLSDPSTSLFDCGDWSVSATWNVPATAVSGVYIAKLTKTDGSGGASHITFVVRNDTSSADIVYQTSDETWEAYNRYGGADFYTGSDVNLWDSPSRARKLSYNRPFATRNDSSGRDFLFSNEYPTIRFLEQNGYDVTYLAGVDTDRYGATLLKNHKVFMSVGHDEYWSMAQRNNVQAARDAGVNLLFLSGNEMYWHTRFEPSIDGSNTAYRTLVCYKTTWDNASTDPTGEATSTFRDPRFAGTNTPENALTGTIYMSNTSDLPITVTAAQGKSRLWRGTGLASMTGNSTALAPHTVGYESDEDLDNGVRPAGLIDLSTTTAPVSAELLDYGTATGSGTTTHHLTLYRAASGALVFSAGTVQWGWGLDSDHDGIESPADPAMRQAMVNMLADMHAQPNTLAADLSPATASTDTQPPTSTITSPAEGAALADGTKVTVTGTATDAGGGQVAGVEVSLDGGASWHPAIGTASWSYTGYIHGSSGVKIESRATDDSANIQNPVSVRSIASACPCSLFGTATPKVADSQDSSANELGIRFSSSTDGVISGVRFYKSAANTGVHTGSLWSADGIRLATGTFTNETTSGWQTLTFATPVAVKAGSAYVASYTAPNGHYSADPYAFQYVPYRAGDLTVPTQSSADPSQTNGVFASSGQGFPNASYDNTNYYVDPIFNLATALPPTVTATTPSAGSSAVPTSVAPTATFSGAVAQGSITFSLKAGSTAVSGTTSYDSTSRTATFTPTVALQPATTYTATISATDTNGAAMAAPQTWSFTTAGPCPCTLFPSAAVPTVADSGDGSAVSLGVKFIPSKSGYVTGARFYKATANTGTHTAALWSATGTQLATATFASETASGWQSVSFSNPVAVTAGSTYIVSYFAPRGHYSADANYFATAYSSSALTAPAGTNGVYVYGKAVAFPASSYNSTNYWVDAVFATQYVSAMSPVAGSTGVALTATPSAVFGSDATQADLTLRAASGSVSGATSYDAASRKITFTPAAQLAANTVYTATVTGSDAAGDPMAPVSWSFTTTSNASCPCTLFAPSATPATADSGDPNAVNLGVKVVPAASGYISGVRFYKSSTNIGTHVGSLWSASGVQLATGTFANETASGWQTLRFAAAVPVKAGVSYVVSYFAPNGHYSADSGYFAAPYANGVLSAPGGANGVYLYGSAGFPTSSYASTNYWVDAIFDTAPPADSTPPTVTSTNPAANAGAASAAGPVQAVFSEPVTVASISFSLKSGGASVPGTTTYDATSRTASFAPSSALAEGGSYTASVSASDTSGNAMGAPYTWSFTVTGATQCPCTLFSSTAVPVQVDGGDAQAVTVGTKFTPSRNGFILGLRFYKAAANTGTHVGTLWNSAGSVLASGTFQNETASGWQSLTFSTAVPVTAGLTYVVGYKAPNGHYSADPNYFTAPLTSGPLLAPAGANGVYSYSSAPPTSSYLSTNYWVDPVFSG